MDSLEHVAQVTTLTLLFVAFMMALLFCAVQCYKLMLKMREQVQFSFDITHLRNFREAIQTSNPNVEHATMNIV
jgi:hypothetical protein